MGAAAYAADSIVDMSVQAAGFMLIPATPFPPTYWLGLGFPQGKGAPGTIAEGAQSWLDAASAFDRAQTQLDTLCTGLSSDQWAGDDRDGFDKTVSDLSAQLGVSADFAKVVGATLAGLAVPLAVYPGVVLGIGGVMFAMGISFELAVASVVGNLGASEAAYAAGCATGSTCLAVLGGTLAGYAALMSLAASVLGIGSLVDVGLQTHHGDESALGNYAQAQVDGFDEVRDNVQAWGIGVATDVALSKAPELNKDPYLDSLIKGGIGEGVNRTNSVLTDVGNGEYGDALKDLSGYGDEIDLVDDMFSDDKPPNTHDDIEYSLPQSSQPSTPPPAIPPLPPLPSQPPYSPSPSDPPIIPIPPAPEDGPNIVPIPNAEDGDDNVIPADTDINA